MKKKVKLRKDRSTEKKATTSDRKKTPKDYPLFSFRLSQADKEEISDGIDELVALRNHSRSEDLKMVRRNDVIVESLKEGLQLLNRKWAK